MTLASPLWLLTLLLLPLLAWRGSRTRAADRQRMDALVTAAMFDRIGRRFPKRTETVREVLLGLGALFLILAMARPQWGIVRERVERTGVDVALVLDTSLSMSVEDVSPNRFFLAKQALAALMTRLVGDRFSMVAFEGEAYPLVPLTLDADAVSLFLETLEPGFVPTPGSNLIAGVEAGIATFVDPGRVNRVLVLVSDGEDLEDSLEASIAAAKKAGVVIHTVGVGSAAGGPVPDTNADGQRNGYKLENGEPVISKLNTDTLTRLAQATGGKFTQVSSNSTSLSVIASAIEAMENRQAASEFSFRKQERFQIPLGLSFLSFILAFFGPLLMERSRQRRAGLTIAALLLAAPSAQADIKDEILARPSRETTKGLKAYQSGDAKEALAAFERARQARPDSPATRFNEAVAQVKAGKAPEAIETFTALTREKNDLGFESHYNLGNALLGAKQLPGAVAAYRDALRLKPDDARARRNLEIALRQLEQQKKDQEKDQKDQDKNDKQDKQDKDQKQKQPATPDPKQEPPKTEKQKENERFQKEAGMSKDQAMQLLKALEQNEKLEQKHKLDAERAKRRKGKDW